MRAPTGADRRVLPFWALQAGQLGAAAALVDLSLHLARPELLLALAAVLAGVTVLTDGPLGVVRILPRTPASVLAAAVSVVTVPAMLVPALRPGTLGGVAVVFVAAGITRLATLTRMSAPSRPEAGGSAGAGTVRGAEAGRGAGDRAAGSAAARRLGRETARLAAAAGRRRPGLERAGRRLARSAGRATGQVQGRLRGSGPDA